jgi:hypothetical protein
VRSHSFIVHTDLEDAEAKDLVAQLEAVIQEISRYWGRTMQGTIECYIIRNFDNFPKDTTDPRGIAGIKQAGGVTLFNLCASGKRLHAKSVVYADARPEVAMHEAVHAYCHQTFGRTGPIWYSEGMAEMGRYWKKGDSAVRVGQREMRFLRQDLPTSLAATLSTSQVSGDSWQNYASRWGLCHFLAHNPNYAPKFHALGRGFLAGKDVSFEKAYGAAPQALWFEYLFFRQHIGRGFRVDLAAWDWSKKFAPLLPGHSVTVTIKAGRGWQPTGVAVTQGTQYECVAMGNWRIANQTKPVDANGNEKGRGRLAGTMLKGFELGPEFDVGDRGSLPLTASGDLYLRCGDSWNHLADNSGCIAVTLKIQGTGTVRRSIAASATESLDVKSDSGIHETKGREFARFKLLDNDFRGFAEMLAQRPEN